MLAIATTNLPTYYRNRYGLQGLGDALDPAADFTCGQSGAFFICRPKTAAVTAQVAAMQRAIDSFLTKLPIFRTTDVPIVKNPIGSSSSGYDGRVGPVTSGVGEVALIGAADMQKAAGEGDPPGDVIIAMRDFTDEKTRTQNFAKFAPTIASYLGDMATRFDQVMAKIQANRSADNQPVVVAPPPIPVPGDIRSAVKKGISKGWLIGGGVAMAGLFGLGLWSMRDKSAEKGKHGPGDDKVHWKGKKHSGGGAADFMGAPRRRRR
jgi:hypothetical protein